MSPPPQFFRPLDTPLRSLNTPVTQCSPATQYPQIFRPINSRRPRTCSCTAGCGDDRRHKLATIEEDNLTRDELDSIAQEIVEGQLTETEELAAR